MKPYVRVGATLVASLAVAVDASPARAGTVTATNACLYSLNEQYRDQAVTLGGSGSPAGALPGTPVTLSGASLSAQLPAGLPEQGYNAGFFKAGYNEIPSRVWISVAATNATPATQVLELSVTASTTIAVQGPNADFVSGTPIVVTIPMPDTTWTVAGDGPVTFSQAGPGTLPNLPVGLEDKVIPVAGSIVVKAKLAGPRFVLDCQPGSTAAPFTTFTPAAATPFAALDAPAPVPPAPAPAPPPPVVTLAAAKPRIASTALKRARGAIGVAIACPGGPAAAACQGRVSVRSLAPIRIGARRRVVTIVQTRAYTVPAGRQRTVRLALTAAAARLLRTRRSLRARVTLDPARGTDVAKTLTLVR